MLNLLNILHWKCTTADKFPSAFSPNGFSKEGKILIKNLWQLNVTLLPVFLENSEPKTGQEHKFWQFWNELLYKSYNSAK